jgi:hypothetical protein
MEQHDDSDGHCSPPNSATRTRKGAYDDDKTGGRQYNWVCLGTIYIHLARLPRRISKLQFSCCLFGLECAFPVAAQADSTSPEDCLNL